MSCVGNYENLEDCSIEPRLYRNIVLKGGTNATLLADLITARTKPASFYETHVKTLCIFKRIRMVDAITVINACRGITSLAIWIPIKVLINDLYVAGTQLQRLSCHTKNLVGVTPEFPYFTGSLFRTITHLDIVMTDVPEWQNLRVLDNLTHLSFYLMNMDTDEVGTNLTCPIVLPSSLRLCIMFMDADFLSALSETFLTIHDPRLVVATEFDNIKLDAQLKQHLLQWEDDDYCKQWGAQSRPDVWQLAESMVETRLAAISKR